MASQANRLESLRSIREDLHRKLQPIRAQLEDINISEDERSQIVDDFHTLDAILEALEEQHVRIVLMGKVNAGKSSLANSLLTQVASYATLVDLPPGDRSRARLEVIDFLVLPVR